MMKIRSEFVLLALLLAYSLLKFSDGISQEDGSSIFAMFSFCCAIRMLSGADDIEGGFTWSKTHRSHAMYLLLFVGFVTTMAVWRHFSSHVSFVRTAETILGAIFFFTAIVVVAAWIGDLFRRSKENRNDD